MSSLITENSKNYFNESNDRYFEKGFLDHIEDHLEYIRNNNRTTTIPIMKVEAVRYIADLDGLLKNKEIPYKLWFTTMRLNGFYAPTDMHEEVTSLLIPSQVTFDELMDKYKRYTD